MASLGPGQRRDFVAGVVLREILLFALVTLPSTVGRRTEVALMGVSKGMAVTGVEEGMVVEVATLAAVLASSGTEAALTGVRRGRGRGEEGGAWGRGGFTTCSWESVSSITKSSPSKLYSSAAGAAAEGEKSNLTGRTWSSLKKYLICNWNKHRRRIEGTMRHQFEGKRIGSRFLAPDEQPQECIRTIGRYIPMPKYAAMLIRLPRTWSKMGFQCTRRFPWFWLPRKALRNRNIEIRYQRTSSNEKSTCKNTLKISRLF